MFEDQAKLPVVRQIELCEGCRYCSSAADKLPCFSIRLTEHLLRMRSILRSFHAALVLQGRLLAFPLLCSQKTADCVLWGDDSDGTAVFGDAAFSGREDGLQSAGVEHHFFSGRFLPV